MQKLLNNFQLSKTIKNLKKTKKKIVLCHGVFDLLHIGHLKHFQKAKSFGDILIVSLTKDKNINKGVGRPYFNESLRAEFITSLSIVDYVHLAEGIDALDIIKKIKPDVYCKGSEYKNKNKDITNNIIKEVRLVKKLGGKIEFSEDITFSSSKILNKNSELYDKKQKKFINKISKNFSISDIQNIFKKVFNLKLIVIGELIFDEYIFSEAVGKSAKEPVLIFKEEKSERYVGGVGPIVKNLSNFIDQKNISLSTYFGEKKELKREFDQYISKKIEKNYIYKKNSPTILKRRYVETVNKIKVFGLNQSNDEVLNSEQEKKVINYLNKTLKKKDLVILIDYGHGLITKKISSLICQKSKFLCLNAQVNSSNIGYQSIKNYKSVDCLVINEKELRQELRDRTSDTKKLTKKLSNKYKLKQVLVTMGSDGTLFYNKKKNKFYECPAFANIIIDKVGAGDTLFSIFSILMKSNVDINLSLLISSIAASLNIKDFANKNIIFPNQILKIISHMIK